MASSVKQCPRCREEVLTGFQVFGMDLNQCPRCHGIWFDAGELNRFKDHMESDARWKDFDLKAYAERTNFAPTKMKCAACGGALCELRFNATTAELEFCARCGGVWADAGKLTPVLRGLQREVDCEPLDQVRREALRQFVDIFIGPKGPWEEAKDFAAAWRLLTLRFMVEHPDLTARLDTARRALPF